jgi:hypothetical protein
MLWDVVDGKELCVVVGHSHGLLEGGWARLRVVGRRNLSLPECPSCRRQVGGNLSGGEFGRHFWSGE